MTMTLIWVHEIKRERDYTIFVGEPLMTSTGIANDNSEYVGELIALSSDFTKRLGTTHLQLYLGLDAEMFWKAKLNEVPSTPFLLTDSDTKRVLFDGQVMLKGVTDLLKARLRYDDWTFAGFRFGNLPGVLKNCGKGLTTMRAVIFGEPNDQIGNVVELRDIEGADEVFAEVELGA